MPLGLCRDCSVYLKYPRPCALPPGGPVSLEGSAQSPFSVSLVTAPFCLPARLPQNPPLLLRRVSSIVCLSLVSYSSHCPQQLAPGRTSTNFTYVWHDSTSPQPACLPLTSWPRPSLMPRLEHPQKPTGHTHGPIRWHAGEVTPQRLLTDKVSPLSMCRQFWLTFHKAPQKFQQIDHQWMEQGPTPKASMYSSSFLLPCFTPCPSPTSDPWNQVRHCVYFVLCWMKLHESANIDHSWPTKMPVSYDLMIICLLFSNRM